MAWQGVGAVMVSPSGGRGTRGRRVGRSNMGEGAAWQGTPCVVPLGPWTAWRTTATPREAVLHVLHHVLCLTMRIF